MGGCGAGIRMKDRNRQRQMTETDEKKSTKRRKGMRKCLRNGTEQQRITFYIY